jgi:hypothetical protein
MLTQRFAICGVYYLSFVRYRFAKLRSAFAAAPGAKWAWDGKSAAARTVEPE